jgi:hypothetical protein
MTVCARTCTMGDGTRTRKRVLWWAMERNNHKQKRQSEGKCSAPKAHNVPVASQAMGTGSGLLHGTSGSKPYRSGTTGAVREEHEHLESPRKQNKTKKCIVRKMRRRREQAAKKRQRECGAGIPPCKTTSRLSAIVQNNKQVVSDRARAKQQAGCQPGL